MKAILCTIATIFILWFTMSTGEIMVKNLQQNPEYNNYNFWIVMWEEFA